MKEHSYYLGEALKSDGKLAELAAKIQASDDDDSVLTDFIKAGGVKLANILSTALGKTVYKYTPASGDTGASFTFTVNAVANFMDAQKDTLKESMLNYLSNYVLAKWLNLIKPDEAQRFETQMAELTADMRLLGTHRNKPVRGTTTE
jgi:hypothetical protein